MLLNIFPWWRQKNTNPSNVNKPRQASDIQTSAAPQKLDSAPITSHSPQTQSLSKTQEDFNWQTVDLKN